MSQKSGIGVTEFFRLWNHNIIVVAAQDGRLSAKGLSNAAFDPIAIHRKSPRLDRDPQSKMSDGIGYPENHAFRKAKHFAVIEKPTVLPRLAKPFFWIKRMRSWRIQRGTSKR